MSIRDYNRRRSSLYKSGNQSLSSNNVMSYISSVDNTISLNRRIYDNKLQNFLEEIKSNKIKYNLLKVLFEYEDNFKLVCDIYNKYIKSKSEIELLNFYLKSLDNFISLIHSDEPIEQLDKTINTVNKYLRVNTYVKNSILFRIGDFGTKFFILFKGKTFTLLPKKFIKTMTFDEYRNHLNILYIFGEDYLLEKTMHNNIQSCDIAYSEIDNNDNRILRNTYKNNYTCDYDKYMKIINGEIHVPVENFDEMITSSDNSEEEVEKKNLYNEINNTNVEKEKNKRKTHKKKKGKYYKILKYFNDNFIFSKSEKERNSIDSIYSQLDIINESNIKEDNKSVGSGGDNLFEIKQKLKRNMKKRKSIIDEENSEENDLDNPNNFKIGIPKELLTKDKAFSQKYKYDGGELPTFFTRNKNIYKYYEEDEKEDSKDEEHKKRKINLNKNNYHYLHYNHVLKMRRNLFIVGYENVGVIYPGMSFGEISLLNENHKRTCTIFVGEESQIGKLNLNEYNITIKSVRAKMRTDSINFLLNTKLFGDISYLYFLNKYWIYFQCKKIHKGDFLFKIGEQCDSIYIIYNGEIKVSFYIDKENIDDLINGIQTNRTKSNIYYINKYNKFINTNSYNSIFERKQKYCLMIGKKGDILGLNDIISYKDNKYLCEGEVTTDYLSYYEINKTIIFNQISAHLNNNESVNDTLNIENIYYIIKTKQDFMIKKLKNIKNTIEQRHKFFNEENDLNENNQNIKNKHNMNKKEENKKLNINKKSLSLYSINEKKVKINKTIKRNQNEKQSFNWSFFKNEKIKENINNLFENQNSFRQKHFSQDKTNLQISNKTSIKNSINSNYFNSSKTTKNSSKTKTLINLKLKGNTKKRNNIAILPLKEGDKDSRNILFENNKNSNNSINNKSVETYKNDENEDSKRMKLMYNPCKPYEFPRIHEGNNIMNNNWNLFKKNKILKFLFLNDNIQRTNLLKNYKLKKNSMNNNYFLSTIKNNSFKKSNILEYNGIENQKSKNIIEYNNDLMDNIYSVQKRVKNKNEKKLINSFNLNVKSDKGIDIIMNYNSISKRNKPLKNNNHSINNKKIQVSLNPDKNVYNSIKQNFSVKNFFTALNNKYRKKRLKISENIFPNIEKSKK